VPATWAVTELGENPWSLRYRTLKRKFVCVVPEAGVTLPALRVAAAITRAADPSQMDPTARTAAAAMRTDRWADPSGEMAQDTADPRVDHRSCHRCQPASDVRGQTLTDVTAVAGGGE